MKRHSLLLVFTVLCASLVAIAHQGILFAAVTGDEDAVILNRGNEFYAAKGYQSALENYLELIERGIMHPYLYYNLGNTYYKLEEIGYAVLYLEKALALKPFDRDTRENLEYVRRSLRERVIPLYNESFFRFLRNVVTYIEPRSLAYFELVVFSILVLSFCGFIFFPLLREKLKKYMVACAMVFVISTVATFSYHSYDKKHPHGIVVEKQIEVMSAPIAESEVLFTIYEGTKTKLLEARDNWIRITLTDGREGWIFKQSLVFI
jgi:tetratricopeptide (TPR) repeat protein